MRFRVQSFQKKQGVIVALWPSHARQRRVAERCLAYLYCAHTISCITYCAHTRDAELDGWINCLLRVQTQQHINVGTHDPMNKQIYLFVTWLNVDPRHLGTFSVPWSAWLADMLHACMLACWTHTIKPRGVQSWGCPSPHKGSCWGRSRSPPSPCLGASPW